MKSEFSGQAAILILAQVNFVEFYFMPQFLPLGRQLLWTFLYKSFCSHMFSFLLSKNFWVELLGHKRYMLILWNCKTFLPKCIILHSHQQCVRTLVALHLCWHYALSAFLILHILMGMWWFLPCILIDYCIPFLCTWYRAPWKSGQSLVPPSSACHCSFSVVVVKSVWNEGNNLMFWHLVLGIWCEKNWNLENIYR